MNTTQSFRNALAAFEAPPEGYGDGDEYDDYVATFEADRLAEWREYLQGVESGVNDPTTFAEFCEDAQPLDFEDWVEEELESRYERHMAILGHEW